MAKDRPGPVPQREERAEPFPGPASVEGAYRPPADRGRAVEWNETPLAELPPDRARARKVCEDCRALGWELTERQWSWLELCIAWAIRDAQRE